MRATTEAEIFPRLATDAATIGSLASSATAAGVPLGITLAREEIAVELCRPMPTRATLLCTDPWLGRLLMVRMAAFGINAAIATDRPAPWEYFVNVIGGVRPLATIRTDHAQSLPAPSVASPLLIIEDARDVPPETYAPRLAWQTTLHVRSSVHERSRSLVDASELIFVCRLTPDAAETAAVALGLEDGAAATIVALDRYEVIVIADRRYRRVNVTPTPTERRLI